MTASTSSDSHSGARQPHVISQSSLSVPGCCPVPGDAICRRFWPQIPPPCLFFANAILYDYQIPRTQRACSSAASPAVIHPNKHGGRTSGSATNHEQTSCPARVVLYQRQTSVFISPHHGEYSTWAVASVHTAHPVRTLSPRSSQAIKHAPSQRYYAPLDPLPSTSPACHQKQVCSPSRMRMWAR